jgi:hypothetical protein
MHTYCGLSQVQSGRIVRNQARPQPPQDPDLSTPRYMPPRLMRGRKKADGSARLVVGERPGYNAQGFGSTPRKPIGIYVQLLLWPMRDEGALCASCRALGGASAYRMAEDSKLSVCIHLGLWFFEMHSQISQTAIVLNTLIAYEWDVPNSTGCLDSKYWCSENTAGYQLRRDGICLVSACSTARRITNSSAFSCVILMNYSKVVALL